MAPHPEPPQDSFEIISFTQSLNDAAQVTRELAKSLQDEIVINTRVRAEFQKDLEHLRESIDEVRRSFAGNGKPSLDIRFFAVDQRVTNIESKCKAVCDETASRALKRADRIWKFVVNNSPVLLTWLGIAIYSLVKLLSMHPVAVP